MKTVLLLVLCLAATAHSHREERWKETYGKYWEEYQTEFNKTHSKDYGQLYPYGFDYMAMYFFVVNFKLAEEHNAEEALGIQSYVMDWRNKFAAQTPLEAVRKINSFEVWNPAAIEIKSRSSTFLPPAANVELPLEIDWRKLGAVTPVQNLPRCRQSCCSFFAIGTLEGMLFRKTGKLESVTERQIIDCTKYSTYYNRKEGCKKGLSEADLVFAKAGNDNIPTQNACKLAGKEGSIISFIRIQPGNEKDLMAAVATVGPISVTINASLYSLFIYKSGVYYDRKCLSYAGNHAVLLVGYGHDNATGMDYWLVKNSWGEDWGEEGYFRLARNKGNHCGIATMAVFSVV